MHYHDLKRLVLDDIHPSGPEGLQVEVLGKLYWDPVEHVLLITLARYL